MNDSTCSPYHIGRLATYLAANAPERANDLADTPRAAVRNLSLAGRIALVLARQLTAGDRPDADDLPANARRRERLTYERQSMAESRRPSAGPHDEPPGAIWHATACYLTEACESPGWPDSAACDLAQLLFYTVGSEMADRCGGEGSWFLNAPDPPGAPATVIAFPGPTGTSAQ